MRRVSRRVVGYDVVTIVINENKTDIYSRFTRTIQVYLYPPNRNKETHNLRSNLRTSASQSIKQTHSNLPFRRSRSFKVTDIGTNRKLIYDFLLKR